MRRIKRLIVGVVISGVLLCSVPEGGTFTVEAASSGWQQDSNGYWYTNPNGSYVTGWKKIKNSWYYFAANGYMATGWQEIQGSWYYFYSSGELATSTVIDGFKVGSDGVATIPGWKKSGNKYWYQNADGTYPHGQWMTIEGEQYHFNYNGYMDTGWIADGNYYYYLNPNGTLATDCWIGGDYVDSTGAWVKNAGSSGSESSVNPGSGDGWAYEDGNWYYYMNGTHYKGWLSAGGGNYYYFYTDDNSYGGTPGVMATNVYVDGWYVTPVGIANEATATAKSIVDSNGGTLRAAYDYSSSLSYSGRTEYVESWGSGALANQGFNYGTGNCYVMAATFYCQALCLGYDVHQIAGWVPSTRGGLTAHSWCEIDESDGTWVYDPNRTMETGVDAYHKYYTEPGTWVYSNYHRMN